MIKELVIASHNAGKIAEMRQMLSPYGVTVLSAAELNLPDVEETGTTFKENAELKAVQLSEFCGKPCLADDSGLCVNALNGRPGVYSARYSEFEQDGKLVRDFDKGMDRLIAELDEMGNPDWSAYFCCMLAYKIPDEPCRFFEGRVNGKIVREKGGAKGFGFDPIFVPNGFEKTFGDFTKEDKAKLSHRGEALRKFIEEEFETEK